MPRGKCSWVACHSPGGDGLDHLKAPNNAYDTTRLTLKPTQISKRKALLVGQVVAASSGETFEVNNG